MSCCFTVIFLFYTKLFFQELEMGKMQLIIIIKKNKNKNLCCEREKKKEKKRDYVNNNFTQIDSVYIQIFN
jgi:hypothetical protein